MCDMTLDERYMREALRLSGRAAGEGEVPVGAVIVAGGRIVARGRNRPILRSDPTAHAEVDAIRRACRAAGNYRLSGSTLYVTLEPCAMCLGAIVQARIGRLVYGAPDPKSGAVCSIMRFPFEKLNHRPEIEGGVLAGECGDILRAFFRVRRAKK
jgi:tRNA(adenine34) deaminase